MDGRGLTPGGGLGHVRRLDGARGVRQAELGAGDAQVLLRLVRLAQTRIGRRDVEVVVDLHPLGAADGRVVLLAGCLLRLVELGGKVGGRREGGGHYRHGGGGEHRGGAAAKVCMVVSPGWTGAAAGRL
jgi:hypothetical protein